MTTVADSTGATARAGRGLRIEGIAARAAAVVVSSVIALEIGLRIYNPFPFRVRGDHILLPAHQSYTLSHIGAAKLDPVTHVTKNSLGFRGPEPPRDWARRLTILTVGGSTTECLFLSDGKTWTDQLERHLASVRPDAWVNNAGFEGHSTFGHLVLMREFVVSLAPKVVLFLTAYNDMKLRSSLPRDGEFEPRNLSLGHRALTWVSDHSELGAVLENFVRMARTYRAGVTTTEVFLTRITPRSVEADKAAAMLEEHRSRFVPGFARRLRALVDVSRQHGIQPVLLTQPALYGDVIDPTTGVNLGSAPIGSTSNGRVEWQALELYNDVTRRLSAEAGIDLIDLARTMPKDSKYFTDWVHYTNEGARLVGDIVFNGLEPRLRK